MTRLKVRIQGFLVGLMLVVHQNWVLGRNHHITPIERSRNSSLASPIEVDISVLEAQTDFLQDIPSLSVQLEEDGPIWEFHILRQSSKRNYFVGLNKNRDAKISIYRHAVHNISSIMAVIQDIQTGFWYEVTPNIEGVSIVTLVPDHDISPSSDPVLPSHQAIAKTAKQQRNSVPSIFNGLLAQSRELFESLSPWEALLNEEDDSIMDINQGDTIIDIMVVWTHRAECIKSHLSPDCEESAITRQNMKLSILFFLQETNTAFRNSGLHLQLRLARAQRVQYEESTFSQALLDLKDHRIPSVQERRQEFKADMVMLLMDQTLDHPETGVAYNNYEHVDADFMYSVVATQYSSVWFLPAHEIGHLFGCSHDRGTVGKCHDTDKTSYGYRDPEGRFRTIMSYPCQPHECDDNQQHRHKNGGAQNKSNNFQCPIIPYFSNNQKGSSYDGAPLGGPANDCVSQIERVQQQIANLF